MERPEPPFRRSLTALDEPPPATRAADTPTEDREPDRDQARAARSAPRSVAVPPVNIGEQAARFAYAQIGKPYRIGTKGPNTYDCSGLTLAAWRSAGIGLPHSAAAQYRQVNRISRADLRPGDLVFYFRRITHVGVYVGNSRIIDAPRPGRRVTLRPMDTMPVAGYGRPATG